VVDLKKNGLALLVAFLNASPSGELQQEIREDLTYLITRPDPMVIGRRLSRGGNSAMLSSYCSNLDQLLAKVNSILNASLRIALGTEKIWQDRYTMERFPRKSEATWVSRGMGLVSNEEYNLHIGKGRGIIRTPLGKVMVVGDLPEGGPAMSERERWYRLIAESLLSGKFPSLRMCRPRLHEESKEGQEITTQIDCNKIFPTSNSKRVFCSEECEQAWNTSYRVEKLRRKNRSAEKDKVRAVLSWLASRIRTVKVEYPSELIDESPELNHLKNHLGELWDDFEPTVEEIYSKNTDFNVMVKKLRPRVTKKLSVYNPSASNYGPTED